MNDRQWREAWEIFRAARDLEDEQRRSYLSSLHADPAILEEVISMLEEPAEEPPSEPFSRTGTRFGRYQVEERLGSGGMGEVYSAHDTELDRTVAVKFLSPEMAVSRTAVERLVREAKAASALNHPHIVTVYEVIRAGDDVAIAMELVEGTALRKSCGKPNEISRTIDWGRQIAQALAAAHRRNIIHRDIKPENLMVRGDGILKVLDFGLARQTGLQGLGDPTTSAAFLAGSLNYMAPEQTRAEPATSASDIFSLGIVLFELATGAHPFRCDSPIDTAHAIAHSEPKRPSALNPAIPPELNALLLRMLDKEPGKRPSAQEVDRQLSEFNLVKAVKSPRRILWVAASVAAVALAGVALFAYRDRNLPAREPAFTQLTVQASENRVTAAAVSPDGKNLAFAAFGGSVFLRRMSDGVSRSLGTPAGIRVERIAWFHDGSRLLVSGFVANDDRSNDFHYGIWILAVGGGEPREIISDARDGVPSPDGTRVALTNVDASIVRVAAPDGSGSRQIQAGGEISTFTSLMWSPDGKRVAYQRQDYVPAVDRRSVAKRVLVQNSYRYSYESVQVETGLVASSARDFSMMDACALADGRMLFLGQFPAEQPGPRGLWEVRTDPGTGKVLGTPRRVASDERATGISASGDGSQVVVVRNLRSFPNVYVADLPPSGQTPSLMNRHQLSFSESQEYPHAWTADGRTVVFESDRTGHFDLYRQGVDRRESEPLVVSPVNKVMASMTPGGQWLLYRETRDGVSWKVMRIPVRGGSPEAVLADENGEFRCGLKAASRCVLRTVEGDQFVFYELLPQRGRGHELARTGWRPAIVGDWDLSPD
ncbi:MAG TPA: protein kinase, partial [Bryobacteraceae bacterium]